MGAKSLVENMYQREELEELGIPGKSLPLTLRVDESHVEMLQAISDRFSHTRAGLGVELLEGAIWDAFEALKPEDRRAILGKFQGETLRYWRLQSYGIDASQGVEIASSFNPDPVRDEDFDEHKANKGKASAVSAKVLPIDGGKAA